MISKKKLWDAQLRFWPDSVRLSAHDMFKWCDAAKTTGGRLGRFMQVSHALQFSSVVFYRIEGTSYMGIRFGVNGPDYLSLYATN